MGCQRRCALAQLDFAKAQQYRDNPGGLSIIQELEPRHRILDGDDRTAAAHWVNYIGKLPDGFILGSVVRNAAGDAQNWKFEFVNAAWERLLNVAASDAIGKTVTEVFPEIEEEWVQQPVSVVESAKAVRFTRNVGLLGRWYEGNIQPLEADFFTIQLSDVTERVDSSSKQAALLQLGDELRDCLKISEMTSAAARIVGEQLNALRAGYRSVDVEVEQVDADLEWKRDVAPSTAGRYLFKDFGSIRDELMRGEPLIVHDVDADSHTICHKKRLCDLHVRALVNMPVRERGKTVGIFVVHSEAARNWTAQDTAFIRNAADRLEMGIARLKADEQQKILNGEISHRFKNSLTIVQVIANQTFKDSADKHRLENFKQRLQALATAQDALISGRAMSADLADLIHRTLSDVGANDRYISSGPRITLGARAALTTSLMLHELATNAIKYGALSGDGKIAIDWELSSAKPIELTLNWVEAGGPPALPPNSKGFGSFLLRAGLAGKGGAEIFYTKQGLRAKFKAEESDLKLA